MCHEIYTICLPIGTVATCEYCGRVFGCDFSPFSHFLRALGLCSSGRWRRVTVTDAGRLETTLEDETSTLSRNGGHQ